MPVNQTDLTPTDDGRQNNQNEHDSTTTKPKKKEATSKERQSRNHPESATHYTWQTQRPLYSTAAVTPSATSSIIIPSISPTTLPSTEASSESSVATAVAAVPSAETSNASSADNNKSRDSLMGSMIGVLGGVSILLLVIILFASKKRRKWRSEDDQGKRGWGVRHSWYSTANTVSSRCPSTLPPPYDEGTLKKQKYLEPPSPIVTKSTQYSPQLAYSPSFSVDHSHLITGNKTPAARMPGLADQQPPPPVPPVPRPTRSTIRTYQAQLNGIIGSSPN